MENKPEASSNGVATYEYPIRLGPKPFNFWRGLYNKDKNYILGRTPRNWGELAFFYTCFYIVLAILCSICYWGLMKTIDRKVPKWQLDESRIGDSPGLGFRPMPANISVGSLIWLDLKNQTGINLYKGLADKFLAEYETRTIRRHNNSMDCGFDTPPTGGKVCTVSLGQFKDCTSSNSYGYGIGKPCIFLKLNRIFNWKPINFLNATDFPEKMPTHLRETIKRLPPKERDQVFVSCNGIHENDKEAIGDITISPQGFPAYFYPYKNDDGYMSPLISVQFLSLRRNVKISIECIAWARNVKYVGGERDRQGSIRFEILLD